MTTKIGNQQRVTKNGFRISSWCANSTTSFLKLSLEGYTLRLKFEKASKSSFFHFIYTIKIVESINDQTSIHIGYKSQK